MLLRYMFERETYMMTYDGAAHLHYTYTNINWQLIYQDCTAAFLAVI